MAHPDVVGGKPVRVVQRDAMVRMEMGGVAMGSGRVGDHVWVRIPGAGDGPGRLELGLVQGKGEMEIGR
jgi:flagella basal body P-ring formation protein FlgA